MLESHGAAVGREVNSRKEPLDDGGARRLLADVGTVFVARGKKRLEMPASEATLEDLKGPTGNYRAPIVRAGDRLLVGFHVDTLEELLAG